MKTILYNPIFINPQAYYVFPRLTRYLQPDNESTAEPANYIGTIEVKVIAYGDTTLKRTYTNTDSIDLSEFKNTWIRISLFTKVGSCVLGEWKIGNMESDLPYIDPEVLASLKAVVIVGNKTNNDSDRAIVKNLVDPDNPFVISNAAYTEGSGYADKDSPYYGAFVTDGIDDLITSTKTVQEMLGGSNEITVVSMIHQVKDSSNNVSFTNYIRGSANGYFRNIVNNYDKTGIYGYTSSDLKGLSVVNNILGDKNDYTSNGDNRDSIINGNFSVQGYSYNDGNNTGDFSSVAWYWTIIANKVLTTDQINQVIAYFNLDRTLNPDILCNTIKQGITNENHAEFGDKLIDFSGNGRDIQLNNIAWNKESGIDDDGALRLDGVNDFGKVTGMPIYKDYTVVADYERLKIGYIEDKGTPAILSKSYTAGQGAFLMNLIGSTGKHMNAYTFGNANSAIFNDLSKKIYYQSKYKMQGFDMTIGSGVDGDSLWLGVVRDNDSRFFNGAIYSLMSFPYSMSKFLIERQLKKYKLGTLYPNMVEFRPIIKANDNYKIFYTAMLPLTGDIWERINTGDYVPVGRRIAIQMSFDNEAKKLVSAVSSQLGNITIVKNSNNIGYTIFGDVLKDKSPQKISITIEQDENYILFNPVITSNVEYNRLDFYLNNYQKRINIGDYIPKDAYLRANFYLKNNVDELTAFIFNGVNIGYRRSSVDDTAFNIGQIYNYDSPQEVNITIDEYIRYEDIVQPYPVLLRFKDENGNEVSWGGKFKVGSTITRIGSIADPESNLLNGLYSISGLSLNGKAVTSSTSIVEKQMVFKTTATYLLDNNEPKCILSPSRLRIPNSSYKLLGYIPDISGHGNHGKINNSAYAGMSGVNGYPVVFGANKTWANESNGYVTSITSNTIHITNVLNAGLALLYSYVKYNGNLQNIKEIPPFKIEIKGLEGRSKFIYKYLATSDATKETNLYLGNGTHELPKSFLPTEALINNAVVGFSISPIEEGVTNFLSDITIKVLPEYEGAYCLDGVDDFVTIPTTVGGKQVLMKVNWDTPNASILYDQRGYNNEFAIYNGANDSDGNPIPAYQGRNNGQTYIDGILNSNIKASELRAITHNITITNELSSGTNNTYPIIGSSKSNAYFVNMALYDFMLFDDISTDDKIKELNEYVGIEAKVELPPYYWDAYGKTNSDADKDTIQQRGIAVGDYDITNYNHAYDKMSGYGGYEFAKFDNELDWYLTPNNNHIDVVSRNGYEITLKNLSTSVNGWYFQNSRVIGFITRDIPFKVRANKSIRVYWDMHSYKISSEEAFGHVISITALNPNEDTSINLRHLTEEELAELDANKDRMYYLLWFDLSTLAVNEEVTIEMLPLYPNGLVYDAVTDYSKNSNIPALDDFTAIMKRKWLKNRVVL